MPDAADKKRLARLSRLTHLDLGRTEGVAVLAPLLPDLQSLVLHPMGKDDPASATVIDCSCCTGTTIAGTRATVCIAGLKSTAALAVHADHVYRHCMQASATDHLSALNSLTKMKRLALYVSSADDPQLDSLSLGHNVMVRTQR